MTWLWCVPNRWGDNRYLIHQKLWESFPFAHGGPQPFTFRVESDLVWGRSAQMPYFTDPYAKSTLEEDRVGTQSIKMHLNVHKRNSGKNLPVPADAVDSFVSTHLEGCGFAIESVRIVPFYVNTPPGVPACPVSVDAKIQIVDPEKLQSKLENGVGRLAYLGFGMIHFV